METSSDITPLEETAKRTIAGFWRRLGALLVDILILLIPGSILGLVFFEQLARIGDLGRLIGFVIAIAYFGMQNSALAGGQTLGKRLLGIKVVDKAGKSISPAKAHIRAAILILPHFFNMFQLPFIQFPDWVAMAIFVSGTAAVFGLGLGIVYLYIFNTRTRQTVHDLVFDTYVVVKDANEVLPKSEILWVHKAVVGTLLAITLGGPFFMGMSVGPGTGLAKLYYDLGQTGGYTFIKIQDSTRVGGGDPFTSLNIMVWLREEPETFEAAAQDVAEQILNDFPEVEARDNLAITVGRGFDIGIGSISKTERFQKAPMAWRSGSSSD